MGLSVGGFVARDGFDVRRGGSAMLAVWFINSSIDVVSECCV